MQLEIGARAAGRSSGRARGRCFAHLVLGQAAEPRPATEAAPREGAAFLVLNATTASVRGGRRVAPTLRRLKAGDDAEHAVEAASGRNGVEVRSDLELGLRGILTANAAEELPQESDSTSSPASAIQPAARSCASCSARLKPGLFAPGPPPIA